MSNSQTSTNDKPFLALASLVIVLTAALAATAWPAVLAFGRSESVRITRAGEQATGDVAQLNYRVAYALDTRNQVAATAVAAQRLARNEAESSLRALETAGESRSADRIRAQAALEASQNNLALSAADRLTSGNASESDIVLAAMVYGGVGKQERIEALKGRVSSVEATRALLRAQAGKVSLAQELRARGLLISSRSILETSEVSLPRNLLLATLIRADGRKDDLPKLTGLMRQALVIDPTNLEARSQLVATLRAQGKVSDADAQQKLLDKLKNGRP